MIKFYTGKNNIASFSIKFIIYMSLKKGGIVRKLILILCFLTTNISFAVMSDTQILNHAFMRSASISVVSDAQSVTDSWTPLGSAFYAEGVNKLGVWITKTINSSQNLRFKIVGSLTASGTSYLTHSETISSGVGTIDDHYVEVNDDNSNSIMIPFSLDRIYPYAQLFVQAGTVGATCATINKVNVTKGR